MPNVEDEPPSLERNVASPGPHGPFSASSSELRPASGGSAPKRERRHQIPGLRRTPYLKLYLLRCDDPETYKSSSRKLIREWIKDNAPQAQGKVSANSQENHDAFEWMIIHVVIPDGQDDFAWPSKSSMSVLEKIKADFNTTSKPMTDRVAQVLSGAWHGGQRHNSEPSPRKTAKGASQQHSDQAWDDLVSKLKLLILRSFDLRVRQYEEDVKQKISQRNLPGWNFCTFFVLKEGLARGFESVGLLEDALVGYDELSVELIDAVREEASKRAQGEDASLLLDSTKALYLYAQNLVDGSADNKPESATPTSIASFLEPDMNSFRERILANAVSAFEFRSYVFSRQLRILLRMAFSSLDSFPNPRGYNKVDFNPTALAEICGRSLSFIASISRSIRQDLILSFCSSKDLTSKNLGRRRGIVENMVTSWAHTSVEFILQRTGVVFQLQEEDVNLPPGTSLDAEDESETDNPVAFVANSPSAASQKTKISHLLSIGFSRNELFHDDDRSDQEIYSKLLSGTFSSLLAQRAHLTLLGRVAVLRLARKLGWTLAWRIPRDLEEDLEDVPLNGPQRYRNGVSPERPGEPSEQLAGVYHESLRQAFSSSQEAFGLYEVSFGLFRCHISHWARVFCNLHCRTSSLPATAAPRCQFLPIWLWCDS